MGGSARLTVAMPVLVSAAAVALSGVVAAALVSAPAARAASPTTFVYTGAEQTYAVPAGAIGVTVTAIGAPGGAGLGSSGGYGAAVTATVPVPSGTTTLYVEVGGVGPAWSCSPGGPAFNGGGSPSCGAGGGGASDVRLLSAPTQLTVSDSRLVVAGGGGGGATGGVCGGAGGSGGDTTASGAGAGGSGAGSCPPTASSGSNGGFGGSQGGAGGANFDYPGGDGGSGSLGQGGYGGGPQGAGGGGGYFGGGGGGAGYPGGGGGAGSSYWVPGATDTSMSMDSTGVPEVQITPVFASACSGGLTLTDTLDPASVTMGQPGQPGTWSFDVTARNCTGGSLSKLTLLGASGLSVSSVAADPSGLVVRRLRLGGVTVLAGSLGSFPDQASATLTVTVAGTVPRRQRCGSSLPLSTPWSAGAIDAAHHSVELRIAAPATIDVSCNP